MNSVNEQGSILIRKCLSVPCLVAYRANFDTFAPFVVSGFVLNLQCVDLVLGN